jgi:hypothetical protein
MMNVSEDRDRIAASLAIPRVQNDCVPRATELVL